MNLLSLCLGILAFGGLLFFILSSRRGYRQKDEVPNKYEKFRDKVMEDRHEERIEAKQVEKEEPVEDGVVIDDSISGNLTTTGFSLANLPITAGMFVVGFVVLSVGMNVLTELSNGLSSGVANSTVFAVASNFSSFMGVLPIIGVGIILITILNLMIGKV